MGKSQVAPARALHATITQAHLLATIITVVLAPVALTSLAAPANNASFVHELVIQSNELGAHKLRPSDSAHRHDPKYPPSVSKLVKLGNNSPPGGSNVPNHLYSTHMRLPNRSPANVTQLRKHLSGDADHLLSNSRQHISDPAIVSQQKQPGLLEKICVGTSNKLSALQNTTVHYQNLAERYRNCTYVIGNLEITWLEDGVDLSFLESIREITGYLLIALVRVDHIRMPNLQIIRGRDLYKINNDAKDEFAVMVTDTQLKTLELPNLREILAGSIGSYNNLKLCHIRTINWDEILNGPKFKAVFVYNGTEPECPACDGSCQGSCWAEGSDMCQKFSKTNCSPQCSQGRCFGSSTSECCHSFCAGGCTGPKQTDCLACKNFYDDGECIQECPQMMRYNPISFSWDPNPSGKFAFGATCVKECPEHLLRDNGACVRTCPPNKRSLNGDCVQCGGPCPKNCQGVEVVHSGNIDQLINCTVIEGSITILDTSFTGYVEVHRNQTIGPKYAPMHPSRLEAFKTLREITGCLNIQANHTDFKDLSYFRNLKTIGGRQTTDMFYALSIIKTSLVSLNLRSLRNVKNGRIIIEDNKDLCFADTIDWMQINTTRREDISTRNNAEGSRCRQLGLQCHPQCARDGCWGPGPDECLSCNNYKFDDFCVNNCTSTQSMGMLSYDSGGLTCHRCHPECKAGCNGTEANHCSKCKNVKDGPYCVSECPYHKYNHSGACMECDRSCADGCTGPLNRPGEGGCNSCAKAIINSTEPTFSVYCIRAEENCPDGYYQEYVSPQVEGPLKSLLGRPVCRKCHPRCKSCSGMGTHVSVCDCANYVAGDQCEDKCPRDYYTDEPHGQCFKCSSECNECFGPTEADCKDCRVYRIYSDSYTPAASSSPLTLPGNGRSGLGGAESSGQQKFNCTAHCPADKPHMLSESDGLRPYCSEEPGVDPENPHVVSLGSTSIILIFIIISVAFMVCIAVYRCQIQRAKTVKLTMQLSGIDDVEPLNPSNLKPNLAPLRSIKETELRRGEILGSGFGGTVYQGFWHPEGHELKKPRAVAIKVLRDYGQSDQNRQFLEEAYIMASVNHKNLVSLLAVCMTPKKLMLVTQLMPLGCLLKYVKDEKNEISSKNLLEWSKQIARGMEYLETHRMVHRDLALRNVLLQTKGCARISDFGLAKLLDIDQNEYHSGQPGRWPIKWLAPECIRERKFTHKSDVWAFGVTVWELLTFGEQPYKEYEVKDVPSAINSGYRLPQPKHVSVDVYTALYACWFPIADQRPSFGSLVQSFINFARDPGRYLTSDLARGSESEDGEYSSDLDGSTEEELAAPVSVLPELTPSTTNRINEMFRFELRRQHHQQHHHHHHHSHQQPSDKVVALTDINNNSVQQASANGCWSMHHTISTQSLGQKSATDQHLQQPPTDVYDYLLPSPCLHERHQGQFVGLYPSGTYSGAKSTPITPLASAPAATSRNPPHSAGVTNEEYFMSRVSYVNQMGESEELKNNQMDAKSVRLLRQRDQLDCPKNLRQQQQVHKQLSTSNGNIPQSLV